MAMNAASLKNLKSWPKGVSGNPSGSRVPAELRGISSLTQTEVTKIISKYARMIRSELELIKDDPSLSAFDVCVISIFQQSMKFGDFQRLSFLLDRAIGKAPVAVEDDESNNAREELTRLSMKELLTLVKNNLPEDNNEIASQAPCETTET
jgi:hypothetical protein